MKNIVQLIGYVGQEPEIKVLDAGKKLANISMATNEVYFRENGDKVEKTEWHRVVACVITSYSIHYTKLYEQKQKRKQ